MLNPAHPSLVRLPLLNTTIIYIDRDVKANAALHKKQAARGSLLLAGAFPLMVCSFPGDESTRQDYGIERPSDPPTCFRTNFRRAVASSEMLDGLRPLNSSANGREHADLRRLKALAITNDIPRTPGGRITKGI